MGHVLNDMHKQAHEAIDEIVPRTGFTVDAAIEQGAINFGQSHDAGLSFGSLQKRRPSWHLMVP